MDYKDHSKVIAALEESQEADRDNREMVREVRTFLHVEDGQWEPDVVQNMSGRPRYTFDMCGELVDDIAGEIEGAQFSISVRPAGGEASEDIAEIYDGVIRNIENMSEATYVYNDNGRRVVESGFGAWRIVQDYGQSESFDQDLFIRDIKNAVDCVWFDANSRTRTHEDANHVIVLEPINRQNYDLEYPEGSGVSIGQGRTTNTLTDRQDDVIIGEIIYFVPGNQRIVKMTDGNVYVDDEKFQSIQDDLQVLGITVEKERTRLVKKVKSRLFDGNDWLGEEQDTVFQDILPVVPVYGNFEVLEDSIVYYGAVRKKMDSQRVYNYSESRKIEEGALAPRRKLFMTPRQAEGHEAQLSKMNTSADPVQFYNVDSEAPQPYESMGPQINPGLETISASAMQRLRPADQRLPGQALGLRSGIAVEQEQNAEDTKNVKYFSAIQRAIHQTGKILVKAIPKVYDTQRQVRIIGEDGKAEMKTLNTVVIDQATGQPVEVTDLNQGSYDVVCKVGPQFQNRQSESREALERMAAIDPSIIQLGKDIWLNNTPMPGMDTLSERVRAQMVTQGLIPQSELTEEEMAQMQAQAAAQGQQQDPNMMIAQAEMLKAQNDQQDLQIKLMDAQTRQAEQTRKSQETANNAILLESTRNRNNAAAMQAAANAHKTMGESGMADRDAATGGVDAYNEITTDLLKDKVPKRMTYNPMTGQIEGA